jgi:fumarylacetoacetase
MECEARRRVRYAEFVPGLSVADPRIPAMTIDHTHDPALRSWVPGEDATGTDFPIQNLPFGRFRRTRSDDGWRIGVAIGDCALDLQEALHAVRWPSEVADLLELLADGNLNRFMAAGASARRALRSALSAALSTGSGSQDALGACIVPLAAIELSLPCTIPGYTDFYTGIHHATTVGRLFRPDNPLLPNYKWVPIGYHGRTSSIVASGHPIWRPLGQTRNPDAQQPVFGASMRVDFELELGFLIGQGNAMGSPIPIAQAEDHLFGVTLLNDWSARDVQAWEYQPLGPFLAKNFATTLSPWVVTMEALAPFRSPLVRDAADPQPLPYLDSHQSRSAGALDIQLQTWLQTAGMRERGMAPVQLRPAS